MKNILGIVGLLATVALATPAAAVDFGLAVGAGNSASSSTAVAGSQGSSASAFFGATQQSSQGLAASGGSAVSILNGNDQASSSTHQSETLQQGQTTSFGLAGSQNSNVVAGVGSSAANNTLRAIWIFAQ
jgi:hypothetical protein